MNFNGALRAAVKSKYQTDPSPDSRRRFDAAFKQGAFTLSKRVGVSQEAKELQVGESNLRNWIQAVEAHGIQAFAPLSQRTDVDAELRCLRDEVRVLRMEKDI